MIKYIGSKRTLVPLISSVVSRLPVATACDLFAGTTRVGQALRTLGLHVHSNDLATYSEALGQAYIVADETLDRTRIAALLDRLAALPGREGYFTANYCRHARYVQPRNGARIDAIRDAIEEAGLAPVERGVVLTSLLEAADRVDSTTGLQMAYLKSWSRRSHNDLELRLPEVVPGPAGRVSRLDANLLAPELDVDLVYVDPPYNQHSFFSNYHVWETLVRWDAPETYGVARKRIDCRGRKSAYNSRRAAPAALAGLLGSITAPWVLVSVSDEGFHGPGELRRLLEQHRHVGRIDVANRRYVGAQIGIYSPAGEKVGTVSRLSNREHLLLAGPDRALVDEVVAELQPDPAEARGRGKRRQAASARGEAGAARKAPRASAVTQAAAASGKNPAEGAPSPVAASSAAPTPTAGQGPRPRA